MPIAEHYLNDRFHAQPASHFGLSSERIATAQGVVRSWNGYRATPLICLPELARMMGVRQILVKDETQRFHLGSFKALGARVAVEAGNGRSGGREPVLVAASAGNHGVAVAWAARVNKLRAYIYLDQSVQSSRVRQMKSLGASIVGVTGGYNEAVRQAADHAARESANLISDTTDDPADEIAHWIMAGYTTLMAEVRDRLSPEAPTHVFVQAGVGGLAAAVCASLAPVQQAIVVEPQSTASLLASARDGRLQSVSTTQSSALVPLLCPTPSAAAWEVIRERASAFLAIDDDCALLGRSALDQPGRGAAVPTSSAGAAGLGALLAAAGDSDLRRSLQLGPHSIVLAIATEVA